MTEHHAPVPLPEVVGVNCQLARLPDAHEQNHRPHGLHGIDGK